MRLRFVVFVQVVWWRAVLFAVRPVCQSVLENIAVCPVSFLVESSPCARRFVSCLAFAYVPLKAVSNKWDRWSRSVGVCHLVCLSGGVQKQPIQILCGVDSLRVSRNIALDGDSPFPTARWRRFVAAFAKVLWRFILFSTRVVCRFTVVCFSVCLTIIFEVFDVESLFLARVVNAVEIPVVCHHAETV